MPRFNSRWLVLPGLLMSVSTWSCKSSSEVESTIQVLDTRFSPYTLTVPAGTTVSWTWNTMLDHTVVVGAANSTIRSEGQTTGSFSYRFDNPGTYTYFCSVHPGVTGTVVVQ